MEVSTIKLIEYFRAHRDENSKIILGMIIGRKLTAEEAKALHDAIQERNFSIVAD